MKGIFYDWGGLNVYLFHRMNDFHTAWLDQFMLWGSFLGEHTNAMPFLALLLLAAFYDLAKRSRCGDSNEKHENDDRGQLWLKVLAVFALGYWLDSLIIGWLKPYFAFLRPSLVLGDAHVHTVGELRLQHSFPSGHAAFALLVCAAIWPLGRNWRILGIVFTLWVGISRIHLGAHFPADVLGGYSISLMMIWIARQIINLWLVFCSYLALRRIGNLSSG